MHAGGPLTPSPQEQQQFFDDVRQTFYPLPRFIAEKFNDRVSSAYRLKGFAGAQTKFSDIIRHDLRLVELTNQIYAIAPGELPGYLFGGLASDDAYGAVRSMTLRFNALVNGDESDAALLAHDLAEFLCDEVEHLNRTLREESAQELLGVLYSMAAGLTEHFKADPPEWNRFTGKKLSREQLKIAISKMISVRFWSRHFRTFTRRWREHLYIAAGDVRRQRSVICSPQWIQHWMASRKRGREIMAETDLEDDETGETLPLLSAVDASVSNNEKRRAEMMTRVKGMEELAELDNLAQDSDYIGLFFTWTAPRQYHAWLETGRRNRKWNGASPRETQRYFTRTFKNCSTALARRDVHIFGMHITEYRDLSEIIASNRAEWIVNYARMSLRLNADHQLTLPELFCWAVLRGVADAMPVNVIRRFASLPEDEVLTGTIKEADINPWQLSARQLVEKKAGEGMAAMSPAVYTVSNRVNLITLASIMTWNAGQLMGGKDNAEIFATTYAAQEIGVSDKAWWKSYKKHWKFMYDKCAELDLNALENLLRKI